jgi:hypothetical protein
MQGADLRRELEGKKRMSAPVIMEMLSAKYGWTPNEIREISMDDIEQYMEILAEQQKLEKFQEMKNKNR